MVSLVGIPPEDTIEFRLKTVWVLCMTGLAKLERKPGEEFMRLFVGACTARRFEGFVPQALSNVLNGEP
jgi:hypothetical protein